MHSAPSPARVPATGRFFAMITHLRRVGIWLALAAAIYWVWPQSALRHPPGVLAPAEPVQQNCPPRALGEVKGYALTAVASYSFRARVLRTKRYWAQGHDLVPYDLAIGWGRMSDQAVLDHLKVSQSNRFFFYRWAVEPPIPLGEIVRQAANVHVISANREVASAIAGLRAGQLVEMRGWLVNVTGRNDFRWNTSLRRDDSGNGACELFYVESVPAGGSGS